MASSDANLRLNITADSSQAIKKMTDLEDAAKKSGDHIGSAFEESTSRMGKAFGSLGSYAAQMGIPIDGVFNSIGDRLDAAKSKGEGLKGVLSSISGGVAAAGAAGVGALAVESFHLADGYDTAKSSLDAAVKASGQNLGQWGGQIQSVTDKMAKLGFNSTDVATALGRGVVSTQNLGKTIQSMGLAADLARMKHISLADATDMVDKAMTGNLRPLKSMGIDLPIAASSALKLQQAQQALGTATQAATAFLQLHGDAVNVNSKYHLAYENLLAKVATAHEKVGQQAAASGEIIGALSQRLGGQATAYASTFGGQMDVMHAQLHNVGVEIGEKLVPIIAKFMGIIVKIMDFLGAHKEILIGLGIVVGGLLSVAFYSWAAALFATDGALSPLIGTVGLIVLAIAAVAIGVYELATHWSAVWNGIKDVAKSVWDFLYKYVFGPYIQIYKDLWDAAKVAFGFIQSGWNDIVKFFSGAVSGVTRVFGTIGDAITGAFKTAFNFVATIWNDTVGKLHFSIPSWIPGIGGKSFGVPQIPEFKASGGPVSALAPYIVGEQGPELFVPSSSGSIIPNHQLAGAGQTINVYVQTQADPNQIAAQVAWALKTKVA